MDLQVADSSARSPIESFEYEQYSTFFIAGRLYGIEVTKVQEVVKPLSMTPVPLAPTFVKGLVNLRGQVATAIGLRELLGFESCEDTELMNVVCQHTGCLVSFLVDQIGDVMEVSRVNFEPTPQTITDDVKRFMQGVYKGSGLLLSILDLDKILNFVNSQK